MMPTGIPLSGIFFAKLYIFTVVTQSNYSWLVVLLAVNGVIGLVYYLRAAAGLVRKPETSSPLPHPSFVDGMANAVP